MVTKLSLSCRQVVAKPSPCVSWLDCWSATFFRIIPATTSRLNCSSRQVVARVCCFLRFFIKPMRYIYHPQLDCYLVAVISDCSRPCELSLSICNNLVQVSHILTLKPTLTDVFHLSNNKRSILTASLEYCVKTGQHSIFLIIRNINKIFYSIY